LGALLRGQGGQPQVGGYPQGGFGEGPGAGGLGGLLQQFQQAGLGHVAQSWVGTGPNHEVTPDQLKNVFGEDRVNEMASQAGMDQGGFLSQLSQHLPRVVDAATPNGRLPDRDDEGTVSV
jgi:uncharacterized protein YidB (DUF937 family)